MVPAAPFSFIVGNAINIVADCCMAWWPLTDASRRPIVTGSNVSLMALRWDLILSVYRLDPTWTRSCFWLLFQLDTTHADTTMIWLESQGIVNGIRLMMIDSIVYAGDWSIGAFIGALQCMITITLDLEISTLREPRKIALHCDSRAPHAPLDLVGPTSPHLPQYLSDTPRRRLFKQIVTPIHDRHQYQPKSKY
ncbi:hypothetical protein BDN71DRAFT_1020296 [Pleurotus eryngii]|uniref:Uncharacterized protein n=1 Tax=Pleurotus eryngii TaxID=5323 RepID=A0A9P6DFQ0_PLEER|nr:hypothetical protein BDN71DRAFT_1020296 [Pleurotus eryngii]